MSLSDSVCLASLPSVAPLGERSPVLAYAIAGKPLYRHLLERMAERVAGPLRITVTDPMLAARPDILTDAASFGRVTTSLSDRSTARFPLAGGSDTELTYVWHLHDVVADILGAIVPGVAAGATVERDVQIDGNVRVEAGAKVLGGARLKGNVYVGPGALVGNGALVRGNTNVGQRAMIGFSAEIKSSILLDRVVVGPSSAVPDCVLEDDTFLGGLVRISNTEFGFEPVSVKIGERLVSSGRKCLGASVAAGARIAGGVRIAPGRSVGQYSEVGAGVVVIRNVPAFTRVRLDQHLAVEPISRNELSRTGAATPATPE